MEIGQSRCDPDDQVGPRERTRADHADKEGSTDDIVDDVSTTGAGDATDPMLDASVVMSNDNTDDAPGLKLDQAARDDAREPADQNRRSRQVSIPRDPLE